MVFEIILAGQWNQAEPLTEGPCSIDRTGRLNLRATDLGRFVGAVYRVRVGQHGAGMRSSRGSGMT
jgi:hypothetical protein